MATVTGLTAAKMLEIEAACIIDGDVVVNDLVLTRHDGTTINAGNVRGPAGTNGTNGTNGAPGAAGAPGAPGVAGGQVFSQAIGDGVAKAFTVVHGFGSKSVQVAVYQTATPFSEVTAEIERTDANTITVRTKATDAAPTAGQYTVVVTAAGSTPTASTVPEVTALPVSPVDGQIVDLLVDSAGTYGGPYLWRCKYRAATAAPYRWHIVGGSMLSAFIATSQSRTLGTYGDLTTVGPAITVPFSGIYVPTISSGISLVGNSGFGLIDVQNGATVADGAEYLGQQAPSAQGAIAIISSASREQAAITVAAAATVVKMVYRADTVNAASFYDRRLSLRPVRIG